MASPPQPPRKETTSSRSQFLSFKTLFREPWGVNLGTPRARITRISWEVCGLLRGAVALKAQKIMFKTLSGSSRFCLGGLPPSDVHDAHCSGALMGFKICGKGPGLAACAARQCRHLAQPLNLAVVRRGSHCIHRRAAPAAAPLSARKGAPDAHDALPPPGRACEYSPQASCGLQALLQQWAAGKPHQVPSIMSRQREARGGVCQFLSGLWKPLEGSSASAGFAGGGLGADVKLRNLQGGTA